MVGVGIAGFSPRNGEVILKDGVIRLMWRRKIFSTSNVDVILKVKMFRDKLRAAGFSPRNGEVILKISIILFNKIRRFQSPQWGSNSKGHPLETA